MPRRSRRKAKKRPKHDLVSQELDDWVLQSTVPRSQHPIAWFEGDDGDLLPAVYSFEDLEPYRFHPRLYNEMAAVIRPVEGPFLFLELPAELRLLVYRSLLLCRFPIRPKSRWPKICFLHIDDRDSVTIGILQTCRSINQEASEVFFGENQFELLHATLRPVLSIYLSPHNIDFVKELKIRLPFVEESTVWVNPCILNNTDLYRSGDRIIGAGTCRPDFLLNILEQYHLDSICKASRLQKLTIVIDPRNWPYMNGWSPNFRTQEGPNSDGNFRCYLHNPDVWQDLASLVKHRPDLEIVILRLTQNGNEAEYLEQYQRLRKNLKAVLGIWDYRETALVEYTATEKFTWTMPPANPLDDPNDMLASIRTLFERFE